MPTPVTDDAFEAEVLRAEKPVLVDFWAQWCGPCKTIAPILDDLDKEMGDQIQIRKLNIDENPNTPVSYQIRSIPTLLLVKNGKVQGTKIGAVSKSDLKSWITSNL